MVDKPKGLRVRGVGDNAAPRIGGPDVPPAPPLTGGPEIVSDQESRGNSEAEASREMIGDVSRETTASVHADPVLRGIMLRLATVGLTALEFWTDSAIPSPAQLECGRDHFKWILDTLARCSQDRDWPVLPKGE